MSEIKKIDNVEFEKTETDDYMDFYWDTLYLADELYDQGIYDEAEELYKKIANKEDIFGDASAHYGYLLDKMGRYDEAYTCFCQALKGDTAPCEGVSVFLDECLCEEDSPYWHYRGINRSLRCYLETCESIGKKPDVERILLNCLKSKDEVRVSEAIVRLIQIYGTGKLVLSNYDEGNYEVVDVAEPDLEKLKTFVAEAVNDEYDVADILSYLCYDPESVDDVSAKALEEALLAVSFDEAKKKAYNMLFCLYLFGREFDIYGDSWIEVPSLENRDKAVSLMSKMDVSRLVNDIFRCYDFDYEAIVDFLEEAHRAYPDDENIAISLLLNVKTARLPELISTLSDNCAISLIPDGYDLCSLTDGGIEIEDAEEFEAYYTSLLDFLTK